MENLRTVRTSVLRQVVNATDGEITAEEEKFTEYKYKPEPPFVKVYLEHLLWVNGIAPTTNTILHEFLFRMDYENRITLNAGIKRIIAKKLGVGISTINNSISKFVAKQMFKRIETGVYVANPHLFAKGKWQDIAKLRLTITYEPEAVSMNMEVLERNENEQEI